MDGSYFGLNLLTDKYILKRVHFETRNRAIRFIRNNLLLLVRHADYLFMEYLYEAPLLMISALKMCRLSNRRIVAVSHTALKAPRNIFLRFIYRMVYSSIDTIMFFSPKNLEESVTSGMVAPQKARLLGWGRNLDYIDSHFVVSDNSFFISTGRENRDVKILIDAFSKTNASLEIYVNKRNYNTGNNYSYLEEYVGKYPNIKIVFMEDTELTYEDLCQRTAEARCVVVPLIDKRVNYCVGLTSVVEAMALGKPIISSPNPYSPIDLEKEEIGFYASTVDEWMDAITRCTETKAHEMGCRARKLAGETYNIHTATTLLDHIFSSE